MFFYCLRRPAARRPHTRSLPMHHLLFTHPEGLLSTQRDEFAIAGWDILLHAVFPGHPFGADPAPPVQPADV